MISPEIVCDRIELYFRNEHIRYLKADERAAAGKAVSSANDFNQQSLNLHSAGFACERFIRTIRSFPGRYDGRGIVICAGGVRYLTNAWVCINMLRHLGCRLPIELWHLGKAELDPGFAALVRSKGVTCVDAHVVRRQYPVRILKGWELKAFSILNSSFKEILLLDADNVPVRDPSFLFDAPEYKKTGAVFWPDYTSPNPDKALPVWRSCGVRRKPEPEFESGQLVVDKERCWRALCLAMWFNENSDFYYRYLHGDKETFHLAFRKLNQPYSLVSTPIHRLRGTMCQHDFQGRRLFQHRNTDKWDFFLTNKRVEGFKFEARCRGFVQQLQNLWNGGARRRADPAKQHRRPGVTHEMSVAAVMISCPEREELRARTLASLRRSDWGTTDLHIEMDTSQSVDRRRRQIRCAYHALAKGADTGADYILFLEDDIIFNRHFRSHLLRWAPFKQGTLALGSLYNPGVREQAYDLAWKARLVDPHDVYGSQALLISRRTAQKILSQWHRVTGMQDIKISRLASRVAGTVFYHVPSLVQHVGNRSMWGGRFHQAIDFDPTWRADPG